MERRVREGSRRVLARWLRSRGEMHAARRFVRGFGACLLGAVLGCGANEASPTLREGASARPGGHETGVSTLASGLPCDVERILQTRCQSCHGSTPQFGASDPLVTFDDLQVTKGDKKLYERVQARIQDPTRPMPPPPNERLADQDRSAIDGWIKAGAQRSAESCGGGGSTNLGAKALGCTADTTLRAAAPFVMPKASDIYVCVGIKLDVAAKRHITTIGPHIDNSKILHHVLLMQASEDVSTTPYVCTGAEPWKLVAGWAPGADNVVMPPEAGFPYDSNSHFALQLHYNNAKGLEGEKDQSGFDFCTTDQLRPNDAGVMAFGSMVFAIPPRSKTTVTCDWILPPVLSNGVKLIQSWPHMHSLGIAMKTTHTPIGGAEKVVVDSPNFSFQDQVSYPANEDVKPGDRITTTCAWKNTTDQSVTWGEGSGSEMCYNFTTYYPAIGGEGLTAFPWWEPSLGAICSSKTE